MDDVPYAHADSPKNLEQPICSSRLDFEADLKAYPSLCWLERIYFGLHHHCRLSAGPVLRGQGPSEHLKKEKVQSWQLEKQVDSQIHNTIKFSPVLTGILNEWRGSANNNCSSVYSRSTGRGDILKKKKWTTEKITKNNCENSNNLRDGRGNDCYQINEGNQTKWKSRNKTQQLINPTTEETSNDTAAAHTSPSPLPKTKAARVGCAAASSSATDGRPQQATKSILMNLQYLSSPNQKRGGDWQSGSKKKVLVHIKRRLGIECQLHPIPFRSEFSSPSLLSWWLITGIKGTRSHSLPSLFCLSSGAIDLPPMRIDGCQIDGSDDPSCDSHNKEKTILVQYADYPTKDSDVCCTLDGSA